MLKLFRSSALIAAVAAASMPAAVGGGGIAEASPTACASLNIHPDSRCARAPVATVTFPSFTEPGRSGCYEDESTSVAVSDQHCNVDTGNFHQLVYPKGIQCRDSDVAWYLRWAFPVNQTFAPDICIGGGDKWYSLNFCRTGPCPEVEEDPSLDVGEEAEMVFAAHSRGLRGDH